VIGETRHNLLNTRLSVRQSDGHVETRTLTEPGGLERLLTEVMGLALPEPIEAIWTKTASQPPL
jgi:arylamine N-acetyltransferase